MRRTLSALLALTLLAAAGAVQAAQPIYVDKESGFQLAPPDGWRTDLSEVDAEQKLVLYSADNQVACNMIVVPIDGTTQAQLDAAFRRGDADEGVKYEVSKMSDFTLGDFSQSRIERDGHPAIYARLSLDNGKGLKMRVRKLVLSGPGRIYNFNCALAGDDEGVYAADLDALFGSLHLSNG